jgi:hypothetical protein
MCGEDTDCDCQRISQQGSGYENIPPITADSFIQWGHSINA